MPPQIKIPAWWQTPNKVITGSPYAPHTIVSRLYPKPMVTTMTWPSLHPPELPRGLSSVCGSMQYIAVICTVVQWDM